MDVSPAETPAEASALDEFARTLALQRQRMQQFVAAQRERIDRVTAEMAQRMRCSQAELEGRIQEQAAELDQRQRRLEMAMSDLREIKAENIELQGLLDSKPAEASAAGPVAGLSWEQEKRRILAALEAEGEPVDASRISERLRIEEVLRSTDMAIAAKAREVEQLRRQLAEQGPVSADDPAAKNEILDQDAVIREERANLQRLQQYWEQMLRQAEIDLSLERARLARERAEIDEKLRRLAATPAGEVSIAGVMGDKKPSRGRWLARLGLAENSEETNRP